LGTKRVRLATLPPEVPDSVIRIMMSRFGEVREVLAETWSTAYRYPVANGIRIAVMTLRTHGPSHMVVAGHRTLVSHEGQPAICHGCDETGHVYKDCPRLRTGKKVEGADSSPTWAEVTLRGTGPNRGGWSMDWVRGFRPGWRR
jgi:hypothetical protein